MSEVIESNAVDTVAPIEGKADVAISTDTNPSHEDLKSQGWSQTEIEMAEKQGKLKKKSESKAEVKPDTKAEPKTETSTKAETVEDDRKEEKAVQVDRRGTFPEYNLTPEKEKALNELLGPGDHVRGTYHRMKNERLMRQKAEAHIRELEAKLQSTLEAKPQHVIDENGDEEEAKPLTRKELIDLLDQKELDREKKMEQARNQGGMVAESLKSQEEYVKSVYPDYDETLKLASDVMQNLEYLIPNKWEQQEAIQLIKDLQIAAANADKYGIDDRNAAIISYRIGKLHPNFGKPQTNGPRSDINGNLDPKKANGSLTPEQMKRMEANTQRGVSSASIPGGGGKRTLSVEDIGLAEYNKMTAVERVEFKTKHPKRFQEILRG